MCMPLDAILLNKVYSKDIRSHCMYFLYGIVITEEHVHRIKNKVHLQTSSV
jgi:hypothetical protein